MYSGLFNSVRENSVRFRGKTQWEPNGWVKMNRNLLISVRNSHGTVRSLPGKRVRSFMRHCTVRYPLSIFRISYAFRKILEGLMALIGLARRCALSGCDVHDLLPARCVLCQGEFCTAHIQRSDHLCPVEPPKPPEQKKPLTPMGAAICNFGQCRRRMAPPCRCDSCGSTFCLAHRHAMDHECHASKGVRPAVRRSILVY